MSSYFSRVIGVLAPFIGLTVAAVALAQTPRSSVDTPATQGVPEFRDPKTGQIWTPLNVGGKSGPPTPADLAFDPRGQAVSVQGVVTQKVAAVPLSSVPITAGPTVPIVNLGGATLSAIPGKRWQVVLYLENNSANTVLPLIDCRFTNGGRLVEDTHALVSPINAGVRAGMVIYGPTVNLFVDRATCGVKSP